MDGPLAGEYEKHSDFYKSITCFLPGDSANPAYDGEEHVEFLRDLIREQNYDVIHIWNSESGCRAAMDFDGKVVVGVYGEYHNNHPFFTRRIELIKELHQKTDLTVIADNPGNADVFMGTDFRHVHTGIDEPDDLVVDRVKNRCIWMGRDSFEKNIELYYELARLMPDFEFILLIPVHNSILDTPSNLKISVGITDRSKIYGLLKSSSYYINTSHMEGTPLALLEAMKCGCIPICSAVGGVVHELRNVGHLIDTGLVEDYRSAILKYDRMDIKRRDEIRQKIVQSGNLHSIDSMAREIEDVWTS